MEHKAVAKLLDIEAINLMALKIFQEVYEECTINNSRMKVAFSGGKTPKSFYNLLATELDIEWDYVDIFMVDEKYVQKDHDASNFKVLYDNLLSKISISYGNVHKIGTDEPIIQEVKNYKADIERSFGLGENEAPKFDIIFMGMDNDGNIGSIYSHNLKEAFDNIVVSSRSISGMKFKRISIGFPVINNAKNVVFLISGLEKKILFDKVFYQNNMSYPISHVNVINGTAYYLVDFYNKE